MTENTPKLFLVDAFGYIFRAFYAMPPMTDPKGTPVGAVYGFTRMLMDLVQRNEASHIGIAFDSGRKTFRNEIYPDYKANRAETPPELIPQFPLIKEIVKAFNLKCLEKVGFEADDLIASYTEKAQGLGMEVVVVSADKDLMQLLKPGVQLFDPMKNKPITEETVMEKFGVTPDKVIDVQALAGDTSDNIPGVSGIGPKTAAELINTYGSVENVLSHTDEIKQAKRREMLQRDAEKAMVSKKLATLCTDAPTEDMALLKAQTPNVDLMQEFFERHGFKSLLGRLPTFAERRGAAVEKSNGCKVVIDPKYKVIQTVKELKTELDKASEKGLIAVDTETTSLNTQVAKIVGFSFTTEEGIGFYVPLDHHVGQTELFGETKSGELKNIDNKAEALKLLRAVLEDDTVLKIGHNIKYDLHIFANTFGDDLNIQPITDTMVQSYVLDGILHGHGMDELAQVFFNVKTTTYAELCGKGVKERPFQEIEIEKAGMYAAEDADITMRLYCLFDKRLKDEKMSALYERIERPLVAVLFKMERLGIKIDKDLLKSLSAQFETEMKKLENEVMQLAGEQFNIQSPMQVGQILFEKMKLQSGGKTKFGNHKADVEVLQRLADDGVEIAAKILEHRAMAKLKNTYADTLADIADAQGRVHTSFSQTVTSTGRLASSSPNLQNIPIRTELGRQIRKAFIAGEGNVLLSADYSQIELRLLAHMGDVKGLKEAFEKGIDVHKQTASRTFNVPLDDVTSEQRRRAKIINFSIIYGISAFGLANQLGVPASEGQDLINAYMRSFPEIKKYIDDTIAYAKKNGYVQTFFGRKCFTPQINDNNYNKRGYAERAAINAPIQGTNADLIKLAMNRLHKMIETGELKANMLLQVHDELVFEVAAAEAEKAKTLIRKTMEEIHPFSIPLIVDVGEAKDWSGAH